jgi:hypothetical protein
VSVESVAFVLTTNCGRVEGSFVLANAGRTCDRFADWPRLLRYHVGTSFTPLEHQFRLVAQDSSHLDLEIALPGQCVGLSEVATMCVAVT